MPARSLVVWWNCGTMSADLWQLRHHAFLAFVPIVDASATVDITLPLRLRLVKARPLCAE